MLIITLIHKTNNYQLYNYKRNRGMEHTEIPIWAMEKCLWNLPLSGYNTEKNIFKFWKGKIFY